MVRGRPTIAPGTEPSKRATIAAARRATGTTGSKKPRTAPRPVTDAERARIRELAESGMGRNEIAREVGRSAAAVSKVLGPGVFDAEKTAEATQARVAAMRAQRMDIAELLLNDALRLRDRAWEPHHYYERGTDDLVRVTLPLPPAKDTQALYSSVAITLRSHTEMMRESGQASMESSRSMLGKLMTGIEAAVAADKAAGGTADAPPAGNEEPNPAAWADFDGDTPGDTPLVPGFAGGDHL